MCIRDSIISILENLYFDKAFIDHPVQAMINGIFNNRLKRNFIAVVMKAAFLYLKTILELVLVAELLNLEIALGMLHLFLHRNQLM